MTTIDSLTAQVEALSADVHNLQVLVEDLRKLATIYAHLQLVAPPEEALRLIHEVVLRAAARQHGC